MKVIRIFPRRTSATPDDENVRIFMPPSLFDEADEIHISVTFTWDLPMAYILADQWQQIAPVKIGGPATRERGEEFVPGKYLKNGYVITSRGCPNKCWFCSVWRREGQEIRELPIVDGYNVLDDNLLACSDEHIKSVFAMLSRQKQKAEFTGGLEAAKLKEWHAEELRKLKPKQIFFAYDTPDDFEPLQVAGEILRKAGHLIHPHSHSLRCYVLCGFFGDTFDKAECRMRETMQAGFTPMAMLYRDKQGNRNREWARFQRTWVRPSIIHSNIGASK
jgi:hypothetical protein